jgi:hypothetical protein
MDERLFDFGFTSKNETSKVLCSYFEKIRSCIQYGWSSLREVQEKCPEQTQGLSKTAKANFIHSAIVYRAKREFSGIKGIMLYEEDGIFTIDFFNKIRLRFKKLSPQFMPNNILTLQQMELNQQRMFGESTLVTAGYRTTCEDLELQDMHLVCIYNQDILWKIKLPEFGQFLTETDSRPITAPENTLPEIKIPVKKQKAEKSV